MNQNVSILGVILVVWGAFGLYTAARNASPLEMNCADYYERGASRRWVSVSECFGVWGEGVYIGDAVDKFKTVMVPIVPDGFEGRPKLVLKTKDPIVLLSFRKLVQISENGTDDDLEAYLGGEGAVLFEPQTASGLTQLWFMKYTDDDRKEFEKLVTEIDDSYQVVYQGDDPEWQMPAILFGIGALLLIPWRKLFGRRPASE
ncbi:MAG: hypothetical protein AAF436_08320 [Myxococcota bacterium]